MSSDDTLSSVLYPVIHTQKAPSLEEPISIDYSAKCSCPNLAIFLSPEFIRCKSSVDVFTAVIDGKPTQHQYLTYRECSISWVCHSARYLTNWTDRLLTKMQTADRQTADRQTDRQTDSWRECGQTDRRTDRQTADTASSLQCSRLHPLPYGPILVLKREIEIRMCREYTSDQHANTLIKTHFFFCAVTLITVCHYIHHPP